MITKFSRSFWETAVAYKGSPPSVLRDYDVIKDHEKGLTFSQLAIKHHISRFTVNEILKKYKTGKPKPNQSAK